MKLCASIATQVVQGALDHLSLIAPDQLKWTAFRALKSIGISTKGNVRNLIVGKMINVGTMLANCAVITTVSLAPAKDKNKKILSVLSNVIMILIVV